MFLSFFLFAQIIVISHRGEHLSHPENTLPAFHAAIDAQVDYIEVDVRTSSDGRLVLMHDATVDRTTNGHGAVREMTFDEIRTLKAGGAQVPTFEEALQLARGKIGVYVDCKDVTPAALVAALEAAEMSDNVVIYGRVSFLKDLQALRPALKVMPEATSVSVITKIISELSPRVIAFDARDFQDDIIRLAQQSRAEVYVDRLGPADNTTAWQHAIDHGASGIQTDHPADLVRYLKSKGLHR